VKTVPRCRFLNGEKKMGMLEVTFTGSFMDAPDRQEFSAEEGGHAMAISRAMAYLSEQLPIAIALDHRLHSQEEYPRSGFGKVDT
jgi:hypothetical protein